ncbi:hypothetical protein ACJZ2D_015174 [Fusarium nematophilum]
MAVGFSQTASERRKVVWARHRGKTLLRCWVRLLALPRPLRFLFCLTSAVFPRGEVYMLTLPTVNLDSLDTNFSYDLHCRPKLQGLLVGDKYRGGASSSTQKLNDLGLQVSAKLLCWTHQELLIGSSLGLTILDIIRAVLIHGDDGLPLGMIGAGKSFADIKYFFSSKFCHPDGLLLRGLEWPGRAGGPRNDVAGSAGVLEEYMCWR